jgi:hypothetical protein
VELLARERDSVDLAGTVLMEREVEQRGLELKSRETMLRISQLFYRQVKRI